MIHGVHGGITLKCSYTIQDSKEENKSDVEMPARMRPASKMVKLGKSLVMHASE